MVNPKQVIVIDDDPLNNQIIEIALRRYTGFLNIKNFTQANDAYEFILSESVTNPINDVIILLDINMPLVTGWDFLDLFDQLDSSIKSRYEIFILTSSIDFNDREKARDYKSIKEYIVKPINREKLNIIFQ